MLKTITNLVALPLLISSGLICSTVKADSPSAAQTQRLHYMPYTPIKYGSNVGQPLIQVTINDTQKATFLVDTGTSESVISTELAKQMNLHLEPAVGADGKPLLFNGSRLMTTKISVLSFGTLRFTDLPLIVLDNQAISLLPHKTDAIPYSGILGNSLLQRFAIFLDGAKHQFGICIPGGLSLRQVEALRFTQPSILSIVSSGIQNKWFVTAQFVNGSLKGSEDMLLDTGSDATDVSEQLAQKINLKPLGQQGAKTAYGTVIVTTAVADELDLGDSKMLNFPLVVRPVSD